MVLHNTASELPFLAAFEHRFPYRDAAMALIRQGWTISLNAAFCVLNELCRPPFPGVVGQSRMRELITEWAKGPDHPLKAPLLRCAIALITDKPLPWREAILIMEDVGRFDGQRAALGLAYSAGDCSTEEGDVALNEAEVRVRRGWDERGV